MSFESIADFYEKSYQLHLSHAMHNTCVTKILRDYVQNEDSETLLLKTQTCVHIFQTHEPCLVW